jgi:hypothetical protein
MKHFLEDHHKEHAAKLGVKSVPEHLEISEAEYAEALSHWKETFPRATEATLHTKILGHFAWKSHSNPVIVEAPQQPAKDSTDGSEKIASAIRLGQLRQANRDYQLFELVKRIGIGIALLLALIFIATLAAPRAHGQFSKISTITAANNDNSQQGFFASPFTFKAGANCSFSVTGTVATFNCSGGAAGAGGSNTQVQYNSAGSLAGITSLTTDGTINTALAGADWLFADLTTPTKKFKFDASNISAVTTRTMNVPDANATFAQAIAAVSHKFITQMSAQGLFTLGQPACADISDAGVFCAGTAYSSLTGIPSTFAPSAHNLLSAQHGDTVAASPVRGDIIIANSTPAWTKLAIGTTGKYPKSNGTDIVNSTLAAAGVGTPTACTNQFVTGFTLNADAAPTSTCTSATLASAQFANQGTTTTLLHGNVAGNPSFAAVTTSDLSSTTGNGTQVATGTGTYTSGNCVKIDANGNLVDNGSSCGGGSSSFKIENIQTTPATCDAGGACGSTEAVLMSWSSPANELGNNQDYHIVARGLMTSTGAPNPTLRLRYGGTGINGTVMVAGVWSSSNISNAPWTIDVDMVANAVPGAAVACEIQGWGGVEQASNVQSFGAGGGLGNTATVSLATNATSTIYLTAQWNSATAGNTVTARIMRIERIN